MSSLLQLPEQVAKRARHVVSENQRTLEAAKALESHDLAKVQALMAKSHLSMRHDFEITVPEVDQIVDIVSGSLGGLGGARMTGGGFGGCVVWSLCCSEGLLFGGVVV